MTPLNTDSSLRRYQIIGYSSIVVVLGVLGAWSMLTQLNSAVIAPATVVAETNSKKLQHMEGGIVRKILVKDGDRVEVGQELVVLDDTDTKAELGIVNSLLAENIAKRARLEAQRDNAAVIEFPPELDTANAEVARIMQGQKRLFESRLAAINGKMEQLNQQVDQITEQVSGLEAQIIAKDRQIALIKDELVDLKTLQQKGLVANARILAMEREQANLEGSRGELVASKASAAAKIGEVKLQILQISEEDRAQSLADLREAEGKIAEYRERKHAAAARLGRMSIKAPITGDIYQVAVHTIGGVISPAEVLMLIVPEADDLILQAQVPPQSRDRIELGQKANVRFPAFNARLTPEIGAEVTQISADTSRVDQNSPPFYLVRLRIPAAELAKLEGKKLKAGMPAETFIQTEAQTPLTYLLKPLMDQIAHTFREQ